MESGPEQCTDTTDNETWKRADGLAAGVAHVLTGLHAPSGADQSKAAQGQHAKGSENHKPNGEQLLVNLREDAYRVGRRENSDAERSSARQAACGRTMRRKRSWS